MSYSYVEVRDAAVGTARIALAIPADDLREAIEHADRALSIGPTLDPTLWRDGAADELLKHLVVLRAVRDFQRKLETLRPADAESHEKAAAV